MRLKMVQTMMKMKMKMMTGKQLSYKPEKFESLFISQMIFQDKIESSWPCDNPTKFHYHITALQEEIGEVLKADKRWKTHRNNAFDPAEKLDELADCFITLMNISMWSGLTAETMLDAIDNKIAINEKRLDKER